MLAQVERQAVLEAARGLVQHGFTIGNSGNVSARVTGPQGELWIAITPHGRYYDQLAPEGIVVVDPEGEPIDGDDIPSVELLLHAAIYAARPDVGAVIHAHPRWSSAAAVVGRPIPPILEDQIIYLGGTISVVSHAMTGSAELVERGAAALEAANACLLANHGALTVGRNPREALEAVAYLEKTAQAFLIATLAGAVTPIPDEVVETELGFFRSRG